MAAGDYFGLETAAVTGFIEECPGFGRIVFASLESRIIGGLSGIGVLVQGFLVTQSDIGRDGFFVNGIFYCLADLYIGHG